MDCPVCRNAMISLELQEVEIDYCTDCGGIWLDAGELELVLGESRKVRGLLESFEVDKTCAEKPHKCPICDRRMSKIVAGPSKPALLIDKCPRGDGLWFDRGELHDILHRAQLDEDSKIHRLLADMFGQDRPGKTED